MDSSVNSNRQRLFFNENVPLGLWLEVCENTNNKKDERNLNFYIEDGHCINLL